MIKIKKGISIHIGVNELDVAHYGFSGKLRGCENDAMEMYNIASINGFQPTLLLTKEATTENILNALSKATETLKSGDMLFITYAGHGAQIPDINGDEKDQMDETWCMYDRMLVDDELSRMWEQFESDVRIFIISDSCHSGTVLRFLHPRQLDPNLSLKVYEKNKEKYSQIQFYNKRSYLAKVKASIIQISACQDEETTGDGEINGLFTTSLLGVWNGGNFQGNYPLFYKKIKKKFNSQEPSYKTFGTPNPSFENQKPFSIYSNSYVLENQGGTHMVPDPHFNPTDTIPPTNPIPPVDPTPPNFTIYDPTPFINEQLSELKKEYFRRSIAPNPYKEKYVTFTLNVPAKELDASDEAVYKYLTNDGSDTLMKVYLKSKNAMLSNAAGSRDKESYEYKPESISFKDEGKSKKNGFSGSISVEYNTNTGKPEASAKITYTFGQ